MKKTVRKYLPWLWFAGIFAFTIYFYAKHIRLFIDADMSSEMILGSLLAKNGGILSKDWIYSTEIRVLNNQIVFALFLRICKSWITARVLSGITLMSILLAAYYFFCRQAGIAKYYSVTAAFLVMPFSLPYAYIVLWGLFYIPHIVISFLTLGFLLGIMKTAKRSMQLLFLCMASVLALCAGMGGPRMIFMLYLPLVLTGIWRLYREKCKSIIPIFIMTAFAGAGYLINSKVLAKSYVFRNYSERIELTGWSSDNVGAIITGLLKMFGYRNGVIDLSSAVSAFVSFTLVILITLFIIRSCNTKDRNRERSITVSFFVMGLLATSLLYLFTNMEYNAWYYLPILIFSISFLGFSFRDFQYKSVSKYVVTILLSALLLLNSLFNCKSYWLADVASANTYLNRFRGDIVEELLSREYYNGYATFWQASVLTELSDGQLDVWDWGAAIEEKTDINTVSQWLQDKRHNETHPEGKVFVLLSLVQEEDRRWPLANRLSEEDVIFRSETFVIYGYNSYEELVSKLYSD